MLVAVAVVGCDFLLTTPFPGFLGYTDISVDLTSRIESLHSNLGEVEFVLHTVYTNADVPRLILVAEPPSSSQSDAFSYRGRAFFFDEDLSFLNVASPSGELDTFGKPFAYGPDGNVLIGNTILSPDGEVLGVLPYQGLEGPAVLETDEPSTVVFALAPGSYSGYDLEWLAYRTPPFPWSPDTQGTLPILPPGNRPSSNDRAYQILDVVYHQTTEEMTFLLSQPAAGRIVAARASWPAIRDGLLDALAPSEGSFPIRIDADRPLDVHADTEGFFLRRRDGWMEYRRWTPDGPLELQGSEVRIVGDRFFRRAYAFFSGPDVGNHYMYRFDASSRVLTRYRRWW
ncbi:MAG: hypothetical protein EA404_08770 [Spirochaetaceae bacterium]|nr:MAG: hypothetical protein EA404_08770 [Spirochaetaceae bacterium]